ncbi:MAG: rhodanese-like domain-containing protein [Gammaproteobacteria bacterium]
MFNLFFTQHYQTIIFAGLLMLFSSSLIAEQKPYAPEIIKDVTTVSAEEVIELILARPGLIVIDSRKKTEYQKGHIEGAINILNTRLKREDLERISPDKSTEILFYCNGTRCLRSADSIKKAKNWGYSNLIWFRGGWKEWTEKRLPVVTD